MVSQWFCNFAWRKCLRNFSLACNLCNSSTIRTMHESIAHWALESSTNSNLGMLFWHCPRPVNRFCRSEITKKFGCILQHSFFSFVAVYAMIRILQFLWFLFLFIFHVSCLTSKVILQKKNQTEIPFHFSYIYFHTYLSHIVEINLTLKCCCNKVNY